MGIFSRNFERPGPGVLPDAPRATGMSRIFELLSRDGWSLYKAGLLSALSILPFCFGMYVTIELHALLPALLVGVLGGMLAGPSLVGIADTALRAMRDEPGVWWLVYRDAWKNNWKAALAPGAILGFVVSSLLFLLFHLSDTAPLWILVILLIGVLFLLAVFTYIFAQIALFNMRFGAIVLNALLLTISSPKWSFCAAFVQVVYWAVLLLYMPLSLILLLMTGNWLPMFFGLYAVYGKIDKTFDVEAQFQELHKAERQAQQTSDGNNSH